jgi:hypothetical protein
MHRAGQVHRCCGRAAVHSRGKLGGRRTLPPVIAEPRLQRRCQLGRHVRNKQGEGWSGRGWRRGLSGQAVPAQGSGCIDVALRLQSGPDRVHRSRISEAVGVQVRNAGSVPHHPGHAEVCQQRLSMGGEEYIAGCDVGVREALSVQIAQDLRDRRQDRDRLAHTQGAPRRDQLLERAAGRVVHQQAEAALFGFTRPAVPGSSVLTTPWALTRCSWSSTDMTRSSRRTSSSRVTAGRESAAPDQYWR